MRLLRLLGHLWTLPNTLIALLFGIGGRYRWDAANEVVLVFDGWMVAIFRRFRYVGMSIGDVILCADDLPGRMPRTYRHELAHTTQSRLLGPLYLPLTILGYALGFLLYPTNAHDASPLEVWADVASGNASANAYLRHRQNLR